MSPSQDFPAPDLFPAGTVIAGPAVIEEYGATVPLHPGFTATVDDLGNLVVTRDVRKDALLGISRQQGVLPDTAPGGGGP